jgi:hypothetical protein
MVSVSRSRETSNRNLVMNVVSRSATHLALAARQPTGFVSRRFPPGAASVAPAASPSRVVLAPKVFGLPFGHAEVIAEHAGRVEVRSRAFDNRTAPRARRLSPVALAVSGASAQGLMVAFRRTEPARLAAKRDRRTAYGARFGRSFLPLVLPLHADQSTSDGEQCQGNIEIDERWVEVARRRLERWHAQGWLDFGSANDRLHGREGSDTRNA